MRRAVSPPLPHKAAVSPPGQPAPLRVRYPTKRNRVITHIEHLQRKHVISTMFANGVDRVQIIAECRKRFGIGRTATLQLLAEVLKEWGRIEDERRPYHRTAQIRRLQSHIAAARAKNAWSAVANLERLLAQILGTLEPLEVRVKADVVVKESLELAVSSLSHDQIRELANRQRELEGDNALQLPAAREVIDA
jgi:hypothetical protein